MFYFFIYFCSLTKRIFEPITHYYCDVVMDSTSSERMKKKRTKSVTKCHTMRQPRRMMFKIKLAAVPLAQYQHHFIFTKLHRYLFAFVQNCSSAESELWIFKGLLFFDTDALFSGNMSFSRQKIQLKNFESLISRTMGLYLRSSL